MTDRALYLHLSGPGAHDAVYRLQQAHVPNVHAATSPGDLVNMLAQHAI
ncbi:MAG: hypothetical protein AAF787_17730 [Chloroflexota bacterium]